MAGRSYIVRRSRTIGGPVIEFVDGDDDRSDGEMPEVPSSSGAYSRPQTARKSTSASRQSVFTPRFALASVHAGLIITNPLRQRELARVIIRNIGTPRSQLRGKTPQYLNSQDIQIEPIKQYFPWGSPNRTIPFAF